ncbi:MAG: transglutaminase domain-containing protein [Oscillospiraceae bacterium]
MKKKLILTTLISMSISVMVMSGNLSAQADTLETYDVTVHDITPKAKVIYAKDNFMFSTVGVGASDYSNSKLSLEEYLVSCIRNFDTSDIYIQNYGINENDLKSTFGKILCEYPDLFYLKESYKYSILGDTVVGIRLEYKCTKEEYQEQKAIIDNTFAKVLDTIDDSMSDYEKALLIHDYLCTNFSYDLTYSTYNLLDFVKTGTGVCQAYYQAYTYMLNEVGIKSYPVQSTLLNHVWNMIEIDGKYYQVDVTWDDYTPDLIGWSSHTNFLLDDESINKNHNSNGVVDWYTYEENLNATDSTFNDYLFKSNISPFIGINSSIYCLNDGYLSQYDMDNDTMGNINDLVADEKWYNLNSSIKGVHYNYKFSSLNPYKDIIFVNSSTSVMVIDTTGQVLDTIYTHNDTENSLIYGMTIRNGKLIIQLESNVNVQRESYGKNILTVCDVEEYYQYYLQNKDMFTNTTTEPTTITEPITTTITTTEPTTTTITTTEPTTITITTTEPTTITTETSTTTSKPNDNATVSELLKLNSYLIGKDLDYKQEYDINNDSRVNIMDILYLKEKILFQ